jgi:hypothetical protein
MDYNRIEELLARYWDCETTIEEEKELRELFKDPAVPEKYRKEAALFGYFEEESNQGNLGEFFDHRVLEEVNKTSESTSIQKQGRVRRMWLDVVKAAAVVAILVTAVFVTREQYQDTQENPELAEAREAFEETKKALLMLSHSMNKGKEQAGKMAIFSEEQEQANKMSIFNEAQEIIKADSEAAENDKNDNKQ